MKQVENFEVSMKRLEEIAAKLEAGDLTLAESISLYKEGEKLAEECRAALKAAELSVSVNGENA